MSPIYQTSRLALYPMSSVYTEELHILHADNAVMRLVGGIYTKEKSLQKIQESEAHWLKHGFGLWCWFLKETHEFVGRGGLRWQRLDNGEEMVEIAYMLHTRFWHQGLASEVAQYSLEVGLNHFGLNKIIALTTLENLASQKVMKKIGLQIDDKTVSFRGQDHLISSIRNC